MLFADARADKSVRRMVLLSDGQANMGELRDERLFAMAADLRGRGVTLSTVGVGVDFNSSLMEGSPSTAAAASASWTSPPPSPAPS
jgi:secreted protein with Ig-like and vWFA domain